MLFWPPVGSPVLYCDLFCVHSPGFAKKTFISYSVSFKESFRQGLVVGIDLKNQTVLLEDGEVSAGPGLSISWLQEAPGGHGCRWAETWVALLKGESVSCGPQRPLSPPTTRAGQIAASHKQRPVYSSHQCGGRHFLSLSCMSGTVLSLT